MARLNLFISTLWLLILSLRLLLLLGCRRWRWSDGALDTLLDRLLLLMLTLLSVNATTISQHDTAFNRCVARFHHVLLGLAHFGMDSAIFSFLRARLIAVACLTGRHVLIHWLHHHHRLVANWKIQTSDRWRDLPLEPCLFFYPFPPRILVC